MVPPIDCVVPLKVTVPDLCVKVPDLVQSPPKLIAKLLAETSKVVPVSVVILLFTVMAPKSVFVPDPLVISPP